MAALFSRYWGKADPAAAVGEFDHHTVLGHSLDVAAVALVLTDGNPVLRDQMSRSTGASGDGIGSTLATFCVLHDIGKIDTRFQRKASVIADALRPQSRGISHGKYDHGTEGFRQVEAHEPARALIERRLGSVGLPLLRAVCGHHGALPASDVPDASWTRIPPSLRREDVTARAAFIEVMLDFFSHKGALRPLCRSAEGQLVQRVAGLCAVADWVGSDVQNFPYRKVPRDLDQYWAEACDRARHACEKAGLLRAACRTMAFGELFPGYAPRDVQILTESLQLESPALVLIEAEMGKGKTEAALSLAARYLSRGTVDGITLALPTMATSNAMLVRVEELVGRLFMDSVQLGLAHGRARRQPLFMSLIERSLVARDPDAAEASVTCARWLLNRKRILLAQVGVGTIDQALQAALVVAHQFVRMFGLSRNVVIIDEVHAYDAYMEVLLVHLLSWLGALQVPVILLSATLPSERRHQLARAWRGQVGNCPVAPPDLATARREPYPMVSVTTMSETRCLAPEAAVPSRTLILERAVRGAAREPEQDVARRLLDAAAGGARVGWIRNTVREAQRAYLALAPQAGGAEHCLFHSRYRGQDRADIERNVLERFGKAAPSGGRVLIATQVVEQSLDLDFDELHTDLAPIDLIFQRAGRLHRHVRPRPAGFERPRLVVHVPSDVDVAALRFGPSRYVYDVATLWITHRSLRQRDALELPTDIRSLVEEAYHPESRADLIRLGGPALVSAEQARQDELTARRTRAQQCCISPTTAEPNGASALEDDEDSTRPFTRDGVSTTLLPLWWDGEGARSLDALASDPYWALDASAPSAWRMASDLLDQTVSIPGGGPVHGLPNPPDDGWPAWRRRFERFANDSGLGSRVVPLPMKRGSNVHRGWLRSEDRKRRVIYTNVLGLSMVSEREGEAE